MKQKEQIEKNSSKSQLELFNLGFEYNKTLQQVKKDMQIRTIR